MVQKRPEYGKIDCRSRDAEQLLVQERPEYGEALLTQKGGERAGIRIRVRVRVTPSLSD